MGAVGLRVGNWSGTSSPPASARASAHGPVYGGVSAFNMEEEEVRRSDAAIDAVAGAMLPSFVAATHGVGDAGGGYTEIGPSGIAWWHRPGGGNKWGPRRGPVFLGCHPATTTHSEIGCKRRRQQRLKEPSGFRNLWWVPLVRALCAYAGGLGEALVRISIQDSTFVETAAVGTSSSKRGVQYILPAGATACAKFSLLAAARLVALNAQARRHGWLSLLVPLCSAFRTSASKWRFCAMGKV